MINKEPVCNNVPVSGDEFRKPHANMSGVTLIELMIVVVIISIIAAIAYPSYVGSITKSRRSVAKATLQDVVSLQEQYFLNNKTYTSSLANLGLASDYYIDSEGKAVSASSTNRVYQITLANASTSSFDVVATPQLTQASRDTQCATFTLSSDGGRSSSGSLSSDKCW